MNLDHISHIAEILVVMYLSICALSQTDGPATLPQSMPEARVSFTPSSNYPKFLGPAASLNGLAAVPGDTIVVDPASVTYVGGSKLTLPAGNCATGQYVTIISASRLLPDEFTRVNPTFAQFMPKIIINASNGLVIMGNCTRLIGFEIYPASTLPVTYNLVSMAGTTGAVLDRNYIHGSPTQETARAIWFSDVTNGTVMNNYIADIHCRAVSGSCNQAQGITGGLDTMPSSGSLVQNNYVEAAGQCILYGGGTSVDTPGDVTIRWNDCVKPMAWNPSHPTFNGGTAGADGVKHPWVVENCMELKNVQRVLIEGNTCDGSWGGFSQVGELWTVTPKNQAGPNGTNVCPNCADTNVTIRYNWGSDASQCFQIACVPSDNGGWPAACSNYSVHDNYCSHLQYPYCYQCGSFTNSLGLGGVTVGHDWFIVHNTFLNDGWLTPLTNPAASAASAFMVVSAPPPGSTPSPVNVHVDYNSFDPGSYGLYNAGGGASNCNSYFYAPYDLKTKVALCWPFGSFVGNQINPTVSWKGYLPWPDGNFIAPAVSPSAGANLALINQALSHRH